MQNSNPTREAETYASFRVSLDDPCWKVLPAALKKYKITDDWRQYALFICYSNQGAHSLLSFCLRVCRLTLTFIAISLQSTV